MKTELLASYAHQLYPASSSEVTKSLIELIHHHAIREPHSTGVGGENGRAFSERDAVLITYADQVQEPNRRPLVSLETFLHEHLKDAVTAVHLLPFYPYTSDDGFAVKDYEAVDPAVGNWDDIAHIQETFEPMFDAVINHVSSQHAWFQAYLNGNPEFEDFFIVETREFDTTNVVRPRATPLFHSFEGRDRTYRVWTTFSEDQVDLNFRNPRVLLACLRTLMLYAEKGASIIRLDAVGYVWKETGSTCLNLPNAHVIVKLIREVFNQTYPQVTIITETNVPHDQNVAYFGDGQDEAQLVYQFTLPPLVLHAFQTGDAEPLTNWAKSLEFPGGRATFFNFLASHDGIGVMPARGYLSDHQLTEMVEQVRRGGGLVSVRSTEMGPVPYEINATWYSAVSQPEDPITRRIDKFIASYAIALSFRGVPGIYVHSLFGTPNDQAGVHFTNHARTINRRKFRTTELQAALDNPSSVAAQVFERLKTLLHIRQQERLFSPQAEQRVLDLGGSIFGTVRYTASESARLLCLHNVSGSTISTSIQLSDVGMNGAVKATDLADGSVEWVHDEWHITLQPYGVAWMRLEENNA